MSGAHGPRCCQRRHQAARHEPKLNCRTLQPTQHNCRAPLRHQLRQHCSQQLEHPTCRMYALASMRCEAAVGPAATARCSCSSTLGSLRSAGMAASGVGERYACMQSCWRTCGRLAVLDEADRRQRTPGRVPQAGPPRCIRQAPAGHATARTHPFFLNFLKASVASFCAAASARSSAAPLAAAAAGAVPPPPLVGRFPFGGIGPLDVTR